jgi:hypothetical protein
LSISLYFGQNDAKRDANGQRSQYDSACGLPGMIYDAP